ncbi:MAG: hypothetical protein WCZ23_07510 [Rhodospirillaceae bacterium]
MAFKPITQAQIDAALAESEAREADALTVSRVAYLPPSDAVAITVEGISIIIPRTLIAEFAELSAERMKGLRLTVLEDALAVADHDVQVGIAGLLADVIPDQIIRLAMARLGGRARSPRKAAAARDNGRKGGRPRKVAEPSPMPPSPRTRMLEPA